MPTLEELSTLDPDLLAAALDAAKKREVSNRLANLPKCRCGEPATQVVKPVITYTLAEIRVDEETGFARIGRWREEDWGGGCPAYGDEPDDGVVWVCCDDGACVDADWRSVRYSELLHVSGL